MTSAKRFAFPWIGLLILGPLISWGQSGPVSARIDVSDNDLLTQPPGANWTSYNGDYTGRRYSSLSQITPENVSQLRAQWVFHSRNSQALEVTPVVINGIMYVTSGNDAFALDARTGRILWSHSRPLTEGLIEDASAHHNRGVAVWRSRVYMETDDAHLLCLDARSGYLIWDVTFGDIKENPANGATSVPLIVNGKVIVAPAGGDAGVRGKIDAYDAETGRLVWRFWTIPGPGEPNFGTWGKGDTWQHGGATAWMPGTYDSETNTLFWGTGNPGPDFEGSARPGDNLYSDCVLALDPDTGRLKWYFQFTPHDLYDYDAVETPVLIDSNYKGQTRKLVVEANRNGFIYVLDRINGKFLGATLFDPLVNWAKGIDAHGRPITTGIIPTPNGTKVCPGIVGATNWFSPSYNPETHLFYFMALQECNMARAKPQPFVKGESYYNTGVERIEGEPGRKILVAYNVDKGEIAWRYPQVGEGNSWAGTLTTAGGVVFFGDDAESFEAIDARDGKPLWHFNTGQNIHASPMTYSVDGMQYVAIAAGSDIFSFTLP
ncbi:MAG TPA: PQQ-dependent dehydrogenase, methanol/ethanol family [Terriglobia bacterium]|nr:PQQ-dependent dehydrogenase, methanol/ethanol family [Terriglobia bacterium]